MALLFEEVASAWARAVVRAEGAEAKVKELEAMVKKLEVRVEELTTPPF